LPKVYNKRNKNFPKTSEYVGRPTKWGNPFIIGQEYQGCILTRELTLEAYEDWLLYSDEGFKIQLQLPELNGKDLVCWCAPLPCHGDILLRLANA